MNAPEGKAVFLSYASQDAEAAKRVCDALRQAGVEVWFDAEGGLEQGDEWDTKIRRQIKECVLFIPIISANTEAREEGYFRLEWDLAAERARTIASGVAFILPVVIDGTKESDTLVPDRFRSVQWTKLPGGNVPPDILQRFLKLWSHRTGAIKHASKEHGARSTELDPVGASLDDAGGRRPAAPLHRTAGPRWKLYGGVTVACITLAAGVAAWLSRKEPSAKPAPPVAAPLTAPATESARMIERMWGIHDKINDGTPEEWAVAEEIGERLVKQDSLDAEAWAALSSVQMLYSIFGMDPTGERQLKALRAAERAVMLAPNSVNARIALATVRRFGNDAAKAEAVTIIRKLMAEEPANRRVLRTAGNVFKTAELYEESLRALDAAAALPGGDPIAHSSQADTLLWMGRYQEARAAVSQSLGLRRGNGALTLHAIYALYIDDNLAEAEATLKELPVSWFQSEIGAELASTIALIKRDPDQCREVLSRYPGNKLRSMPKGIVLGSAYRAGGRLAAARAEWERVLRDVEAELAARPTDAVALSYRALVRALLGRTAEAVSDFDTWREMQRADSSSWRTMAGRILLELGREQESIEQLGAGLEKMTGLPLLGRIAELRRSPDFDRIRNRGEFQALLAQVDAILPRPSAAAVSSKIVDKSVAVLAFANLSDDKANEYFSDGISEELLNVLAKVPGLKVTARTSSFFFKGNNLPIPEIAAKLGVAYVIEGSVQRAGDQVKITAQLIKAADGFHVWSDTFKRDAKDVFAVEEEIAGLIARSLSLKLGVSSTAATVAVDPQVLELYLQARQAWNLRTEVGYDRAEELLNHGLTLQPNFARAHAALADVWGLRAYDVGHVGRFDQRHSSDLARIMAKARQALALDPDSAEAHASAGSTLLAGWDFAEAERELRRAIELNPNYASAHQWLGRLHERQGLMDEALGELKIATELDPLSARIASNYGIALYFSGQTTAAIATFDRALVARPDELQAIWWKSMALARLGRHEEAVALIRRQPPDHPRGRLFRVIVLAKAGLTKEAEALLPGLDPNDTLPLKILCQLAFGRRAEALALLESGALTSHGLDGMFFDEDYDPLRSEPRFALVLNEVGLTEAYARAQAWRAAHPPEKAKLKQ